MKSSIFGSSYMDVQTHRMAEAVFVPPPSYLVLNAWRRVFLSMNELRLKMMLELLL